MAQRLQLLLLCVMSAPPEPFATSSSLSTLLAQSGDIAPPPPPPPPAVYPACSSDSDCYDHPLYRCVGCRYNASRPAGICYGASPAGKATCQCMAEAPGDQCGATNFKPAPGSQLPSYLMIGDSISLGMVKEGALFSRLNGTVQPVHSPGNACNANRGAHCVKNWLDGCVTQLRHHFRPFPVHFSALSRPRLPQHAPCDIIHSVPMLIGCGSVLGIRCCDRFGRFFFSFFPFLFFRPSTWSHGTLESTTSPATRST